MLYPGNPIKSLIIEFIAEKNFASAKDILASIFSYFQRKISLQCIYKNLDALISEEILVRHNKFYTFSLDYLEKIQCFSSTLQSNVSRLHNLHEIIKNLEFREKMEFTMRTVWERLIFTIDFMNAVLYQNNFEGHCYRVMNHYAACFLPVERDFLSKVQSRCEIHDYVYGNTPVDKLASKHNEHRKRNFVLIRKQKKQEYYYGYIIYQPYVITCKHSYLSLSSFTHFLEKQDDYSVYSPQFFYYYKYQYLPSFVTIEKNYDRSEKLMNSFWYL